MASRSHDFYRINTASMTPAYPQHRTSFRKADSQQNTSPLFTRLPSEIRNVIFTYALSSFVDRSKAYPTNTFHTRPCHEGPHISDCALLSTCQQIYHECWSKPWTNCERTFYLTEPIRGNFQPLDLETFSCMHSYKPPVQDKSSRAGLFWAQRSSSPSRCYMRRGHLTASKVDARIRNSPAMRDNGTYTTVPSEEPVIYDFDSDSDSDSDSGAPPPPPPVIETAHLQIFAQLYKLEPGISLRMILTLPLLRPQCITITIRHHDWWFWEDDRPLLIRGRFVDIAKLPPSTRELRMELESLQRKKAQIDYVAASMCESWTFQCQGNDAVLFRAKTQDCTSSTWSGSSTFTDGKRWIRDEVDAKPGMLEYYVKTVLWKPVPRDEEDDSRQQAPDIEFSAPTQPEPAAASQQSKTPAFVEIAAPSLERPPLLTTQAMRDISARAGSFASEAWKTMRGFNALRR